QIIILHHPVLKIGDNLFLGLFKSFFFSLFFSSCAYKFIDIVGPDYAVKLIFIKSVRSQLSKLFKNTRKIFGIFSSGNYFHMLRPFSAERSFAQIKTVMLVIHKIIFLN